MKNGIHPDGYIAKKKKTNADGTPKIWQGKE